MLNQLLRFTLVSSALLWLRPRWRGLLALAAAVFLIHVLHGEYLGYVELSGDRSFLIGSYVFKWVALIISVGAYLFLAVYRLKPDRKPPSAREPQRQAPAAGMPETKHTPATDDGFDFLRRKKTLESRADKVISKHSR